MASNDLRFLLLCAGEIAVLLAGLAYLPAAIALQVLVPLYLFRDRLDDRPVAFVAAVAFGTILAGALLVLFRHTLLPLVITGAFAALALAALILAEARLQRHYGGAA